MGLTSNLNWFSRHISSPSTDMSAFQEIWGRLVGKPLLSRRIRKKDNQTAAVLLLIKAIALFLSCKCLKTNPQLTHSRFVSERWWKAMFFLHGFELKIRRFQRWKNIWPAGMNSNGSTSSLKLRKQKLPYDNINVLQLLLSPSLSLKTQRRLARQIMEGCSVQEWRKHVHGPFRSSSLMMWCSKSSSSQINFTGSKALWILGAPYHPITQWSPTVSGT